MDALDALAAPTGRASGEQLRSTRGCRRFAQQPPRLTAPQMFWIVKHGVRYTGMGAWDKLLSDDEIWKVVTFLNHMEHLPPRVAEEFQRKR